MNQISVDWGLVRRLYGVLFLRLLPVAMAIPVAALAWVCLDAGRWPNASDMGILALIAAFKVWIILVLVLLALLAAATWNLVGWAAAAVWAAVVKRFANPMGV